MIPVYVSIVAQFENHGKLLLDKITQSHIHHNPRLAEFVTSGLTSFPDDATFSLLINPSLPQNQTQNQTFKSAAR